MTVRNLLLILLFATLSTPSARLHGATAFYRGTVLADSPIGYWELDEAAGAVNAVDSAGTPQHGLYANVLLGQTSAFPNLGTCGSFNGTSSRVRVPADAAFNLGTGDFTVECWYKTTVTGRGDIFNFKNSIDFGIFANQAGAGTIGGYHNGLLPTYNTGGVNAWHHVVYVRSAGVIRLYVDGVDRGSQADTISMSANTDIIIGANQAALWYTGLIDEVAYYGTALSAQRVLAHYNAAQSAPTLPAVVNAAPTNVYATSATLNATVTNTGNEPPTVTIFYGATDGGTTAANWAGNVSLGAQSGSAGAAVNGFSQATGYFYRARAVNSAGTAWAATSATFTTATASAPTVQNLPATNITGTTANLRGQVTGIGNQPPNITIYYGTTDGGTNPAAWGSSVSVSGPQAGTFFQPVAGLTQLTTYYYRCFAQNIAGSGWAPSTQSFATPVFVPPNVVINELHINEDDPTIHSEFIELYNASGTTKDLSGWFFDKGINFTFPAGTTLGPGAYLVVCEDTAIMQSRYGVSGAGVISWQDTVPAKYNSLANNGETVTLRDAGGNKIDEIDFKLGFPWPTVGDLPSKSMELIHPSLDNGVGGNWRASVNGPTPRAVNSVFAPNAAPATRQVAHAAVNPLGGQMWMRSGQQVRITAKVTDPDGVQSVSLQYQVVEPGDYIKDDDARYNAAASWTALPMGDGGVSGDEVAADDVYSAVIPASVQMHRRLVRYRITVTDTIGASVRVPYADDPQPNFAYFVYDGVPDWSGSRQPGSVGAVNYTGAMLSQLQQYHLITRVEEHATAQSVPVIKADGSTYNPVTGGYTHGNYLWKGALCHDGVVYDHIRYRARGGVWRFAMGKNMWKFDFNRGHDFAAKGNYGELYDQRWKKMNFSAVIQQADFGSRGEQGLYESVGFRLFQLTGMPAEHTQFVHFRIVERPNETNGTANQFDDDFQGLYLGIEQQDGQFLDEHGLPDGNLYKMEGGTGELNNQGPTQPTDKSDLNTFLSYGTTEQWWRTNCDLTNYYNYRAIVDCIHHYDIAGGKNYFYYHYPDTNKWAVLPWDLDLTWTDNAYPGGSDIQGLQSGGTEPFFSRVFGNGSSTGIPALQKEHRNRVREVLDLLYTPEQAGMLIDEMASFIYQPGVPSFVDADRAMWDYNPIMIATSYVNSGKAGQGRFYQSAVDNPATPANEALAFPGMIQKMKNYVATRRGVITTQLLTSTEENLVPTTPVATLASGPSSSVPTNALTFTSTAFSGKNGATFSAMKWRIAAVTDPAAAGFQPYGRGTRRLYEADPANTWESPEITSFNANFTFPPTSAAVGQTYRVRVKHRDNAGRWSHWSAPVSFTASQPDINVYLQSLVVSQFMYNPAEPNAVEKVIAQNADSYEWIELRNVGPGPLDLTPVRFTKGIDFAFAGSAVTTLAPGARVVVVKNLAAFNKRYEGKLAAVQIAGEWNSSDSLSNAGEEIKLSYGAGTAIRDFIYDDVEPWPVAADQAYALVLLDPTSLPDHSLAANWRSSTIVNGHPGLPDGTTFAAWAASNSVSDPTGDEDRDGLNNLQEYVLRGSPTVPSPTIAPETGIAEIGGQQYLTFTFRRNLATDDVAITPQISTNLANWNSGPAHVVLVSETNHTDGSATLVYRAASPFNSAVPQFMRLLLEQR